MFREAASLTLSQWDSYVLALITYPHAVSTRYPLERLGPSDYGPQLGIVSVAPRLCEINERAIATLAEELRLETHQ